MSSRKRPVFNDKDDNPGTHDDNSASAPYGGPASRLRSRPSLQRADPTASLKEVGCAPAPEPARKQDFEVVIRNPPPSPPTPIPAEIKRKKPKNAYAETMIDRWPVVEAREAVEREIALHKRGLHTGEDTSAWEEEVVSKMKWINERMREGYSAFVQRVSLAPLSARSANRSQPYDKGKFADTRLHDSSCHFPTCRRGFQDGQYRISFEPSAYTGTATISGGSIDLTRDHKEVMESNDLNPSDNEKGAFFCLECFDNLLMPYYAQGKAEPTDPFSGKLVKNRIFHKPKPGYLRPSPSCRIYDRIQPETRSGVNRPFVLLPKEREVIMTWKAYNYNHGLAKLSSQNGFMFTMGLSFDQVSCRVNGLAGVGIAEFMAVHFPKSSVPTAQ